MVSIGVAYKGRVVVGVIYEPHRDELFSAVRGRGASLNGAPMRVSGETAMRAALIGYGLHHQRHVAKTMLRSAEALIDVCRGMRALGSAALMMAYVACGRLTVFYELCLNSWDLAAGALLVEEAGGRVGDMRGGAYDLLTRDVLASNGAPDIHDGTLAVLAASGSAVCDPASKWPPLQK